MANYPESLDVLTNPTSGTDLDDPTLTHSLQHATLNDIVEAIEAKLGIGSSASVAGSVLSSSSTGSSGWTTAPAIRGPYPYADVEAYGAHPEATPSINRAAIQAAIDMVLTSGGGMVLVPRWYQIDAALYVNSHDNSGLKNLSLVGVNRGTSGIEQITPSQHCLVVGSSPKIEMYVAKNFELRSITLEGGDHVLHLDNTQYTVLDTVSLHGGNVGLWTQGSIEEFNSKSLEISGSHVYAISIGNDNGVLEAGTPSGHAPQYMQKSTFNHTTIHAMWSSGEAFVKISATWASSGNITMRDLRCMGGPPTALDISYCYALRIDNLVNEVNARLPASNTYSMIKQGQSTAMFILENSWLTGATNDPAIVGDPSSPYHDRWKYIIEQQAGAGRFIARDCVFGVTFEPGTADIYAGGTSVLVDGCIFNPATPAPIIFAGSYTRNLSELRTSLQSINLVDDWIAGSTRTTIMPAQGSLAVPALTSEAISPTNIILNHTSGGVMPYYTDFAPAGTNGIYLLSDNGGRAAMFEIRGPQNYVNTFHDPAGILQTQSGSGGSLRWSVLWNAGTSSYRLANIGTVQQTCRLLRVGSP